MPSSSRPPTFLQGLARIFGVVAGLVLTLAGLVLMVFTLLAGLVVAVGLTFWARLRGRQPPARPRRGPPPHHAGPAPAKDGDIVDVQVREIPDRPDA